MIQPGHIQECFSSPRPSRYLHHQVGHLGSGILVLTGDNATIGDHVVGEHVTKGGGAFEFGPGRPQFPFRMLGRDGNTKFLNLLIRDCRDAAPPDQWLAILIAGQQQTEQTMSNTADNLAGRVRIGYFLTQHLGITEIIGGSPTTRHIDDVVLGEVDVVNP